MKTVLASLALPLLCLLSACTAVVSKKPVGEAVAFEEVKVLAGEWSIGTKDTASVTIVDDTKLHATWTEEGDTREGDLHFTQVGNDIAIVWVELGPEQYLPLRILSFNENAFTLLAGDPEYVKSLLENGTLKGHEDKEYITLEPDGLEPILATKDFWELRGAWPLHRTSQPPSDEPTPDL